MSSKTELKNALQSAFESPTRGVIGLVDDLLMVSREHSLQLDWQDERCRVRTLGQDRSEVLSWPLRKPVFRAILARVAALCNEQHPDSVSPYGGQSELLVDTTPPATLNVMFSNTPTEQTLNLIPTPRCLVAATCLWKDLQQLLESLHRIYTQLSQSQIHRIWESNVVGVIFEIAVRTIRDPSLLKLLNQLFVLQANGKSDAERYGTFENFLRISSGVHELGMEHVLMQLKSYAEQLITEGQVSRKTATGSDLDVVRRDETGVW